MSNASDRDILKCSSISAKCVSKINLQALIVNTQ